MGINLYVAARPGVCFAFCVAFPVPPYLEDLQSLNNMESQSVGYIARTLFSVFLGFPEMIRRRLLVEERRQLHPPVSSLHCITGAASLPSPRCRHAGLPQALQHIPLLRDARLQLLYLLLLLRDTPVDVRELLGLRPRSLQFMLQLVRRSWDVLDCERASATGRM